MYSTEIETCLLLVSIAAELTRLTWKILNDQSIVCLGMRSKTLVATKTQFKGNAVIPLSTEVCYHNSDARMHIMYIERLHSGLACTCIKK